MKKQTGSFHYAWVIMFCCISLNTACVGILVSSQSQLFQWITADLNCSLSSLTLYLTIMSVTMALLYPAAGRLLERGDLRTVLSAGALLQITGLGATAFYHSVFPFYLSGILMGVGGAITMFLATPILINSWFVQRTGFAMGVSLAFTGVGAAVFSPIAALCAEYLGWRAAALIMAASAAVIVLPCTVFLIKRPDQMGLLPYGIQEKNSSTAVPALHGLTRKEALSTSAFYLSVLFSLALSATTCLTTLLPTFASMELKCMPAVAALSVSCVNLTNIVCKFLLGWLNDRFGIKVSILFGVFFLGTGLLGLIGSISHPQWLLPACVVFGLGFGLYNVETPLLVRRLFGSKHYAGIWSLVMTITSLASAFVVPIMNLIYDQTGSYRTVWCLLLGCCLLAVVSGFLSLSQSRGNPELSA